MPSHRHVILCADTRIRSQHLVDETADTGILSNIFQTWKDATVSGICDQVQEAIKHWFSPTPPTPAKNNTLSSYEKWWDESRADSLRFCEEEKTWLRESKHTAKERFQFYSKRPHDVTKACLLEKGSRGVTVESVGMLFKANLKGESGITSIGDGLRYQCILADSKEAGVCHSGSCYLLIHVMNVCYVPCDISVMLSISPHIVDTFCCALYRILELKTLCVQFQLISLILVVLQKTIVSVVAGKTKNANPHKRISKRPRIS
jgi:hypothetical protein